MLQGQKKKSLKARKKEIGRFAQSPAQRIGAAFVFSVESALLCDYHAFSWLISCSV